MTRSSVELDELVRRGYRFAMSLTHDAARADDLLQDAWFGVLRARGPWSRQYLFTTIRNRFVDQYRRERIVETEPLENHPEAGGAAESQLWDGDESLFMANGALDQALGRLRPEERAVLYLAAVEGFTAQQIADLLDWPRGTVLSMSHRARGKLKRFFVETESGSGT